MEADLFTKMLESADNIRLSYNAVQLTFLLGNAIVIGILLCIVTYVANVPFIETSEGERITRFQLLLGTSHILFLCVGLTAVMILVNNNLARAFAIGAAIALVRFRIKLGKKSAVSNILFGIITGIACGLGEVAMAWMLVVVYLIISALLYGTMKYFSSK